MSDKPIHFRVSTIRAELEKVVKRCDFSIKYIILPCLVVSMVMVPASIFLLNKQMSVFHMFMVLFNVFTYWFNTVVRDRHLSLIDKLDELKKQQQVQDLNPFKR